MERNFMIILLSAFAFQSCQGSSKTEQVKTSDQNYIGTVVNESDEFKAIKSVQVFKYKVNNADAKEFGFLSVEEDQSIGVRSITLYNDLVFVTDPFHGNIKKISLNDGKISRVSQKFDVNNNLRINTVFNGELYVLTDDENIFLLNLDLIKTGNLSIPKYKWVKDVFKQTANELILFRPIEDVIQQADKSMKILVLKIDRNNAFQKDSLIWSYDEYNKSAYGTSSTNIRGKQYDCLNESGNHFFYNEYGKFKLKEKLPTTYKYYDSKNIDFSASRIVYYSVTPNEVTLTVYNY